MLVPRKMLPKSAPIVKIQTTHTVADIERLANELSALKPSPISIWLPRDIGSKLFKDTRIVTLLALGAIKHKHLTVIDWHAFPKSEELEDRFGRTLEGIACLEYADEIVSSQKTRIDENVRSLRKEVIEKNGIVSPEKTAGRSLTFCAFDPDLPIPLEFINLNGKSAFHKRLSGYRRECFEKGIGEGFTERLPETVDQEMSSFAYELWQNALQHGRLDEQGREIPGMRYLRIQKHVDYSLRSFLTRAEGFPELHTYLETQAPKSGNLKFYEITIADHGLGIVYRLLATRPELAGVLPMESPDECINIIMDRALSSKRSQSGAGHGLARALSAVRDLRGFVSLRSGPSWLYYSSASKLPSHQQLKFVSVQSTGNHASVGTQFSLIFPLTAPSKP